MTGFAFRALEDRVEKKSCIWHRACEWADTIEARRKRNHAVNADAAESGFEADDAAKRSRNTDGAAGVSADAAIAKTGCECGSRASA